MAVRVEILPDGRVVEEVVPSRDGLVLVKDLVEKLRRNGHIVGDVVIVYNGKPVPEDAVIPDGASVTALRVLSGGGS